MKFDMGQPLSLQIMMEKLRLRMEKTIRAQCSEYDILEIHDKLYTPIKQATTPVQNAIERSLNEALGENSPITAREDRRTSISALRNLLEQNAKERDLQNALLKSGLLGLSCRVVEEVRMEPSGQFPGMRMDLVLDSMSEDPSQIIELKRGSHLLLARAGKPTERLSATLKDAVNQLESYGNRIDSDSETRTNIERQYGLRIEKPELRLIAGRRLFESSGYHLLSQIESKANDATLQLQIYTWDGFLAEMERIFD